MTPWTPPVAQKRLNQFIHLAISKTTRGGSRAAIGTGSTNTDTRVRQNQDAYQFMACLLPHARSSCNALERRRPANSGQSAQRSCSICSPPRYIDSPWAGTWPWPPIPSVSWLDLALFGLPWPSFLSNLMQCLFLRIYYLSTVSVSAVASAAAARLCGRPSCQPDFSPFLVRPSTGKFQLTHSNDSDVFEQGHHRREQNNDVPTSFCCSHSSLSCVSR